MDWSVAIVAIVLVAAVMALVSVGRSWLRRGAAPSSLHREVDSTWLVLVVGLLFLGGAISNLVGAQPDRGNALVGGAIAAALLLLFLVLRSHRHRSEEFEAWLLRQASAIESGGASYEQVRISPTTTLVRYRIVVSALFVTFRFPTRYYIAGHDATGAVALVCTLASLVLGWWGIPWGPVYTVQCVFSNLGGGVRQSVAERIAELRARQAGGGVRPSAAAAQSPGRT